jgi:exodeoxyribonuclease-3
MKIVTWNINSVRLRLNLLQNLAEIARPDVICLQETKASDEVFPQDEIKKMGYEYMAFSGQKSYNGVAILSKYPINNIFSSSFFNNDKRHISAKIGDIEIHNFYIPAGGDEPDIDINPKFKHKLEYIKLVQDWFLTNRNKNDKIILLGDLNIAPHKHDVWSSSQLKNVVSHTPIERELLINLQNSFEFIDSARHFTNMDEKLYSWWSYRNKDWQKSDRGRRLDHIWVSLPLKGQLKSITTLKEARSWDRPSDHVPFILDL